MSRLGGQSRERMHGGDTGHEDEPPTAPRWVLKDPARLHRMRNETSGSGIVAEEGATLAAINGELLAEHGMSGDEDATVMMTVADRESVRQRLAANSDISENALPVHDTDTAANNGFGEGATVVQSPQKRGPRKVRSNRAAGQRRLQEIRQARLAEERKDVDPRIGKAYFERLGIQKPEGDDELWTGEVAKDFDVARMEAAEARRQAVRENAERLRQERIAAKERAQQEEQRQAQEWNEYVTETGRGIERLDNADFWLQMEQVLPQLHTRNDRKAFAAAPQQQRQKLRSYLSRLQRYALRRKSDEPRISDAQIKKEISDNASAMKRQAVETAGALQHFLDEGYEEHLDGIALAFDPDITGYDDNAIDHKSPKRGLYRFRKNADGTFRMTKIRGSEANEYTADLTAEDVHHIVQWNIDDLARRFGDDILDEIGQDPVIQMNNGR